MLAVQADKERRMVMKIIETKFKDMQVIKAPVVFIKEHKSKPVKRDCNLCGGEFQPHSRFERFCDQCREESELYHFCEWLSA